MSGSSDEIINALARGSVDLTPRRNINLLFAHCDALRTDQILNLLRASRLAPRGHSVNSADELQQVLGRRSWDLLVMAHRHSAGSTLSPERAIELLRHQDRDLPLLLLTPGDQFEDPTPWLGRGVEAVIPEARDDLLLLSIKRSFDALELRRELLQARINLAQLNEHTRHLEEHSRLAICRVSNGLIRYANPSFARLFGCRSREQLERQPLRQLLAPRYREALDQLLQESSQLHSRIQRTLAAERADGTGFQGVFSVYPSEQDGEPCLAVEVGTSFDDSEQAPEETHPVSGLRNQTALLQALDTACRHAHRGGQDRSLLLISLDHLDVIRSEVGSDGVERVLRDLSSLLKQQISPAHLLAHLDDDSFVVLMHNADPDKAVELGQALCHAINAHVSRIEQTTIHTTVSIGVVMINDSAPAPAELLQRARISAASLHHGNRPGNGVSLYQSQQTLLPGIDGKMSKRLLNAIKLERFRLLFQPVVPLCLNSSTPYYEVLLRLISDSERSLSPNTFIAEAIDPEVLIELDRWVIGQALERLGAARERQQRVHLLINLSGASMRGDALLQWLDDRLRLSRVAADSLIFQISESDAAVNLMEVSQFVRGLQRLGCQTCLKHFGSSPNSEHVRRELNTAFIKLDGSHVQDLENRLLDLEALKAMLEPLKAQGKLIIAPLVESTRVISDLYAAGVHLIQGYYLQQPREQMDYDFFDAGPR